MKLLILLSQVFSVFSIPIVPEKLPVNVLLTGLAYKPLPDDIRYVPVPQPIGVNQDEGGCCISCGYSWCPSTNICVRPWETYCQELDFPYNALYKGSGIIMPPDRTVYEN
jgi:hypothetical protein